LTTGSETVATEVGLVSVPDVLTDTVVGGSLVDNVVATAVVVVVGATAVDVVDVVVVAVGLVVVVVVVVVVVGAT
jgi:hypothetical protein